MEEVRQMALVEEEEDKDENENDDYEDGQRTIMFVMSKTITKKKGNVQGFIVAEKKDDDDDGEEEEDGDDGSKK